MKATDVRALIQSTIESTTPAGGKLATRDAYRYTVAMNPSQGSRAFTIEVLEYPSRHGPAQNGSGALAATGGHRKVTFAVGFAYELREIDRALDDMEHVESVLRNLPKLNNGILLAHPVEPLPDRTVLTYGDNNTARLAAYSVTVIYDGRA